MLANSGTIRAAQLQNQVSFAADDNLDATRPISGSDWPINTSADSSYLRPTTARPDDLSVQGTETLTPKTVFAAYQTLQTRDALNPPNHSSRTPHDQWSLAVDELFLSDRGLSNWREAVIGDWRSGSAGYL